MTIDERPPTGRPRRLLAATSVLLAGALVLSGCAASTATGSTVAGSTATGSSAATSSTVAAAATAVTASDSETAAATIEATTAAVEAFLANLSDEQREQVLYDYDDETKTTSWSNFPVTFVERAGLNLSELTEEQQVEALQVLEALLSDEGYETVSNIIAGDQYLLQNSSSTESSLGQYFIAFFGDGSDSTAFEVQFGGHHLGINATLDAATGAITFAPTHLGAQPAVYVNAAGEEARTLGAFYESAFAFWDSLTAEQQAVVYQGEELAAMQCEPGGTCAYPTGTGIAGADLTAEQRRLLLAVIANWVGMADAETTATALAAIESTLDTTYVNWSGATVYDMTQGDGVYFQISGPDVYIEFAGQQGSAGADVDGVVTAGWGHVHTIYRDPTNDYANSVEQQAAAQGGPSGG